MKYFFISIATIALLASLYLIPNITDQNKDIQLLHSDLAEINKINYGIFNLDHWKKEILVVFENKIGEFEISPKAYEEVVKELDTYLRGINRTYIESGKIFEPIFEDAEKSGSINKVFLKLLKDNTVPQIKELHIPQYIPSMSRTLANELKSQEPRLRDIMRGELLKMLKYDAEKINDPREKIYEKYAMEDRASTTAFITAELETKKKLIDTDVQCQYALVLLSIIVSIIGINWVGVPISIILLSFNAFVLLYLGVSLPMINLEALLNAFTMDVLGTPLSFDKQYLYYQSKSILQVTETLIESGGLDTKVVGYLVFCFSIVFPFTKMGVTMLHVSSAKFKNNKWVEVIIFYLGKWSMADVFVVAIFMSYIGFYGLLTSQLISIARNNNGFAIETLNNSSLSFGALYFTTYCILSIVTSIIIQRNNKKLD